MPATNAWDETLPLGTDLASTLDNIIRQLKLDVRERENRQHVFGVNTTDDGLHRNIEITAAYMAANLAALKAAGFSLTGSSALALLDLAGTWNTSGIPTGIKLDISDLGSNAASLLLDLLLGGTSKFAVRKDGLLISAHGALLSGAKFQIDVNGNIVKLNNVTVSFPSANAAGSLSNDGAGTLSWVPQPFLPWVSKSIDYTVVDADHNIDVDASGAVRTITLKAAPGTGQAWHVHKADASGNKVTVAGNGKNINGASTFDIFAQYENYRFEYNGTEYRVK